MTAAPVPVPEPADERVVASAPAPKVAAVARVPVRFLPVPRQRPASRPRVAQLVAAQLVLLAAAVALPAPGWVLPVVAGAGVVVLLVAFGRSGGRWWYELSRLRRGMRARQRAARAGDRPAVPRLSVPVPSVAEVELRGTRFGVGLDDDGWFAGFAIVVAPGPAGERRLIETVDRLGEILTAHAPVSALQLVHHTVPAGTPAAPAGQWLWVALRLAAGDAAAAASRRGGGVPGVHRAVAAAVGRVQKTLRAAGLAYHQPLSAEELAGAVAMVAGSGTGPAPAERWRGWYGPDGPHVCFRLSGAPAYSLSHLVAGLSPGPVRSFTISVLLYPGGDGQVAVEALLRVALADRAGPTTVDELRMLAARLGLELTRLDGEHGRAVYATAPTARRLV